MRFAAIVYAVGLALHTTDHLRRGIDTITQQLFWAGNLSTVVGLATVALILMRHRLAPLGATVFGFAVAFGVSAAHLLPQWSVLSDPLIGAHPASGVAPVSWAVVLIEICGAFATGVAGLRAMRTTSPRMA